jgi:hypothetical protein
MSSEQNWPLIERLNRWLKPQPKPAPPGPTPEPAPANKPNVIDYLKAWKTLQGVPVEKLGSLAVLIPAIVFLAISGMVAWAAILTGLFLRILWLIVFGERRAK